MGLHSHIPICVMKKNCIHFIPAILLYHDLKYLGHVDSPPDLIWLGASSVVRRRNILMHVYQPAVQHQVRGTICHQQLCDFK